MDFINLLQEYGPFVALVAYIMWENKQRETKYQERESTFIEETKKREEKYIEREEKYIGVIESLTTSYETMQRDISEIKETLEKKGGE